MHFRSKTSINTIDVMQNKLNHPDYIERLSQNHQKVCKANQRQLELMTSPISAYYNNPILMQEAKSQAAATTLRKRQLILRRKVNLDRFGKIIDYHPIDLNFISKFHNQQNNETMAQQDLKVQRNVKFVKTELPQIDVQKAKISNRQIIRQRRVSTIDMLSTDHTSNIDQFFMPDIKQVKLTGAVHQIKEKRQVGPKKDNSGSIMNRSFVGSEEIYMGGQDIMKERNSSQQPLVKKISMYQKIKQGSQSPVTVRLPQKLVIKSKLAVKRDICLDALDVTPLNP